MKKNKILLNYNQITDVFYGLKEKITQQNKSVIGRALVGGLLFGGAGAVVGSVSGIGNKEKKDKKTYFIISFTSTSGEDCFLEFQDTRMYKGKKVANTLKELANIKTEDLDETQKDIQL